MYYSLSEAKQMFNRTVGPTVLTWISLFAKQILGTANKQQILERQFPMECREPFSLISESDLIRLFYYGNTVPFPCNWFQIGSFGVRSPNAPLDVIPSDTNASSAMKAYYSHGKNALMPSEGTGCTSELSPVIVRQVPSLPRRLRGDNIRHVK